MNKQDIINEWFYRLPNGYANPPYSKKEMDVLHEILEENDMNGSVFVKEMTLAFLSPLPLPFLSFLGCLDSVLPPSIIS